MAGENELLLKISGDSAGGQAAFDSVKSKMEQFADAMKKSSEATQNLFHFEALEKIGEISEKGFDILKDSLTESLVAFSEADSVSRKLTNTLQNQGIYTDELKEKYDQYAKAVSRATGVEDTQIAKSQAVIQGLIRQIPVTQELTQAIVDLAANQGITLTDAATQMGKAIGEGTGQLLRQGLKFSDTATEAERYAKTLEFVNLRNKDAAASANAGSLGLIGLKSALDANAEALGARFAPAAAYVIKLITDFITPAKDATGILTDFKAAGLAAGLVITGIGVALPIVAQGFLAVRAAAAALSIAATPLILIPVAIAAIVAGVVLLALNWETVSARVKLIVQGLVTFISGAFSGLGTVIAGAMSLSTDKIKDGLAQIKAAFSSGMAEATAVAVVQVKASEDKQSAIKKEAADKEQARREAAELVKQRLQKANDEKIIMQTEGTTAFLMGLKDQEIKTLEQMDKARNEKELALLQEKYAKIIERQQKFGATYRAIAQALASDEVQGVKTATGELVALQNSKNATLKAIGKAAAITQITIKTAESAMNVFNGFSAIPIVGTALGIAAAAAVVAYGAEQIGDVTGAADGGLLTGGIPGRDSIPVMAMQGELISPTQNFEEVIGSVRAKREADKVGGGMMGGSASIELSLKDGLMDFIEAKIVQRNRLNLSILGA